MCLSVDTPRSTSTSPSLHALSNPFDIFIAHRLCKTDNMHIFLSFAALALAGQAAAAGQCSLKPLDDKTLQQLTGGQSGGTTVTSGSMSGPSPARTSTQPKRRAVSTSSHLVRRAGTGETPKHLLVPHLLYSLNRFLRCPATGNQRREMTSR